MIASMRSMAELYDDQLMVRKEDWWRTFALALMEEQGGAIIGKPRRNRKQIKRARKQATKSKRRG